MTQEDQLFAGFDSVFDLEQPKTEIPLHPLEKACQHIRENDTLSALGILQEHRDSLYTWRSKYDNTIVNIAAWHGCVDVLDYLFTTDARIFNNPDELTVFSSRHIRTLEFLSSKGLLRPNGKAVHGTTPLQQACNAADHFGFKVQKDLIPERLLCIEYLINAGADVNATNDDGRTAAMGAACIGACPFIDLLVRFGADVSDNIRCREGKTTLHYAFGDDAEITIRQYLPDSEVKRCVKLEDADEAFNRFLKLAGPRAQTGSDRS